MKKEHQEIIDMLSAYLTRDPEQRFGQALFNLRINEFSNRTAPYEDNYQMRDIHGDSDKAIISRMKAQLAHFDNQKNNLK